MLYWFIPYVVAVNVSNTGDWKYGPEYNFKAEINSNATLPMDSGKLFYDTTVDYSCRPMNSTFLQCRIDSTAVENSAVPTVLNLNIEKKKKKSVNELGLDNVIFQIEFEEKGIYKVVLLNINDTYRKNMIYAIIGTMHMGIDLVDKKLENNDSDEESMVGICNTNFKIRNMSLLEETKENEKLIDEFNFYVPLLKNRTKHVEDWTSIIIEKIRYVNDCSTETFYLFGTNEDRFNSSKTDQESETLITYSQSQIFFGNKSFRSVTENLGTVTHSLRRKSGTTEIKVGEKIQVSLESIKPAKEELSSIRLANIGERVKSKSFLDASLQE